MKLLNKRNIIILGAVLAVLSSAESCKLESVVYDSINSGSFPKTEADAEALVTANAYGAFMNNGYSGMFNIATGVMLSSDLMSDYGECSWRQWEPLMYLRFTSSEDNNNTSASTYQWAAFMGKMTMTIDRIENMTIDEETKKQYLAELHCARGFLAFCMYDLFGPIPIADIETLKDPLAEKILPRQTEEQMQEFIVNELTQAANVLPYNYDDNPEKYGRFTKGLCKTVLMKFYMQTKQWAEAEAIGKEIVVTDKDKYGYGLMPKYTDIFTKSNEKNKETIWAVSCKVGTQTHKWHPHVLPNDFPASVPENPYFDGPSNTVKWNGWKISWDFFNKFFKPDEMEGKDDRLKTIIYKYTGTSGVVHNQENDTKTGEKLQYGAVPFKYQIDPVTTGEDSEIDWIIYRYADVLTLYAEAMVRNSGSVTQDAVDLLNLVRERSVPGGGYELGDFSDARAFLDELLAERARELYYEGCRRQDLIRDGSYVQAIKDKCQFAGQTTAVNENYYRLPLPQSIITEGQGKIENNPGF